ncbi:MAG TPA: hypothetical protein VF780_03865 [Nitrosospira sp.]
MNKSVFLALGCVAAIYGAQPKWGMLSNAARDAKNMNLLKNIMISSSIEATGYQPHSSLRYFLAAFQNAGI